MGIFSRKLKVEKPDKYETMLGEIKNKALEASLKKILSSLGETNATVSKDTLFQIAASYQAVNIISSQIALLPCPVYKVVNGDKIKDKKHPAYKLLNVAFNPYMTANRGWQIFMANALTSSAGYIYIERKNGLPVALYPINTDKVTEKINERTLKPSYEIDFGESGGVVNAKYTDIIKVQGLTDDPTDPKDPLFLLRNVLRLTKQAESFGNEYFENGIHPTGIFKMAGHLEEQRAKQFKKEIKEQYSGLGRRHKALLLEDGMDFTRVTVNPEEGQMTETRKFQIVEIARFFNIPPTKLFELDRATWSNLEELNIQFVQETIAPWVVAIQQTLNMQLLSIAEEDNYVIEFNLGGLLRGKMSDRYTSYAAGRQWGFLSVNEIRELENMSNIGEQGDIYLTPANMLDSNGVLTAENADGTKKEKEEKDSAKKNK